MGSSQRNISAPLTGETPSVRLEQVDSLSARDHDGHALRDPGAAPPPGGVAGGSANPMMNKDMQDSVDPEAGPNEQDLKTISDSLGRQLQAVYGQLIREPVPPRFLDLLDRLEGATPDSGAAARQGVDEEKPK